MKRIAIFILIVLIFSISTSTANPSLEVTGIMLGSEPLAVVDGKVVKKGDKIGEIEVLNIGKNFVEFQDGEDTFVENLKTSQTHSGASLKKNKDSLFFGVQVNDLENTDAFTLSDEGACKILINSPSSVEPIYAELKFGRLYGENWVYLNILNESQSPIRLNYFSDKYFIVNKRGETLQLSLNHMFRSYPEILNPRQGVSVYNTRSSAFEAGYGRFSDIEMVYGIIDNEKRFILLKPCPL